MNAIEDLRSRAIHSLDLEIHSHELAIRSLHLHNLFSEIAIRLLYSQNVFSRNELAV